MGRLRQGIAAIAPVALGGSSVFIAGCGSGDTGISVSTSSPTFHTGTTTTSTTPQRWSGLWNCTSSRVLQVVAPERKGMAVDDTTMTGCIDEMGIWPHSNQAIQSLRLFDGWKQQWDPKLRENAWQDIKSYVDITGAQILIGVDPQNDAQSWKMNFDLMKLLGPQHIMGVSFGNEVDLRLKDTMAFVTNGWLFKQMKTHVAEMDAAGFHDVPITSVFTAGVIKDIEGTLKPFFKQCQETWGSRFVWSFNPYSIWDRSVWPHDSTHCQQLVTAAVGLDYVKSLAKAYRDKLNTFVGNANYKIWLTETGWSSPVIRDPRQQSIVQVCPLWGDKESLWALYKNLMEWDLSIEGDGKKNVDHLFWFTMHDSNGVGLVESFGLVSKCGDTTCKISDAGGGTSSNNSVVVV